MMIFSFLKVLFKSKKNEEKEKLKNVLTTIFTHIPIKKHLKNKISLNYDLLSIIDLKETILSLSDGAKVFLTEDEAYMYSKNLDTLIVVDLVDIKVKNIYKNERLIIPSKYLKIDVRLEKGMKIKYLDTIQFNNILYASFIMQDKNQFLLCIVTDYMQDIKKIKIIDTFDKIVSNKIMPDGTNVFFVIGFIKNNKMFYSYYTFDGQRVLINQIDEFGNIKFSGKYLPEGVV